MPKLYGLDVLRILAGYDIKPVTVPDSELKGIAGIEYWRMLTIRQDSLRKVKQGITSMVEL